ncbi:MAG: MotA/TolQ/ExbB proton channel family protein [Oscillospiraceae bacterium]|jgi:biopolymer transport protein ExbB/TolQ|nr:MotA/TolQ/ExbB proton channel family protein [Oscillospiraceae bacterium]
MNILAAVTTATEETFKLNDVLRAVASKLEAPCVAVLILLIIAAVALFGWLVAELFTEHRHLKVKLPLLLEDIRLGAKPLPDVISESGLLKRQKAALLELTAHPEFDTTMREALAVRLIEQEQASYDMIVKLSELVSRLGPMFGLLGTLIPLGPGIIALGRGDTYALSTSLLTAFDTTIVGLITAAVATVITTVRKTWYKDYMSMLDVLMSCVLEIINTDKGREAE